MIQVCIALLLLVLLWLIFRKPPSTLLGYNARVPNGNIRLVILVMTGPDNKDRRDAMRETWLSSYSDLIHSNDVKHYFVIGSMNILEETYNSLIQEQNEHHDILLLEDLEDGYKKLTEKLAMMFEWVDANLKYEYVFKVDDDTFALLDAILHELSRMPEKRDSHNLYWGYFYGRGNIKTTGPWKETEWKLCDYYLPYARGGGYIVSNHLVKYVAQNWRQFQMYNSEDVSLGAWLAPLKLNRVHDVRFDTEYKTRGCKNDFIVCHKQSIADMKEKHDNLMKVGTICAKEVILLHGYNYNWDVPPSKCCVREENIP